MSKSQVNSWRIFIISVTMAGLYERPESIERFENAIDHHGAFYSGDCWIKGIGFKNKPNTGAGVKDCIEVYLD